MTGSSSSRPRLDESTVNIYEHSKDQTPKMYIFIFLVLLVPEGFSFASPSY